MQKKEKNVDGIRVSYLINQKDSLSKYLVFIHGWGQNKECFTPFFDENFNCNIISVDLPGFGESSEPKEYLSNNEDLISNQYANTVMKFLKEFNPQEIILVGHSYGCKVSFWLAKSELPISKLILTGAAGILPKRTWKYYLNVYGFKFQKILLSTPFYSQFKEDVLKNSGSEDYKNSSDIMKKIFVRTVNEDLRFLIKNIKKKTILFWGISDDATPIGDGILMNEFIENSILIKISGSHFAFLENSNEFKEIIKENI